MQLENRLYCRILAPVCAPIVAHDGDIMAVWLGDPRWNVRVIDPVAEHVRRRALVDELTLYRVLQHWHRVGIISPLTRADASLLQRFRRSA